MAYSTLKAAIQAVIKQNGNNEITGPILQQALLSMINSLGDGYQFKGVATPATNPGTPDQNVFYIASEVGAYSNFGLSVGENEVAVFLWNGSWSKQSTGAASVEAVNQLGQDVNDIYTFLTGNLQQLQLDNAVINASNYAIQSNNDYKIVYVKLKNGDKVRFHQKYNSAHQIRYGVYDTVAIGYTGDVFNGGYLAENTIEYTMSRDSYFCVQVLKSDIVSLTIEYVNDLDNKISTMANDIAEDKFEEIYNDDVYNDIVTLTATDTSVGDEAYLRRLNYAYPISKIKIQNGTSNLVTIKVYAIESNTPVLLHDYGTLEVVPNTTNDIELNDSYVPTIGTWLAISFYNGSFYYATQVGGYRLLNGELVSSSINSSFQIIYDAVVNQNTNRIDIINQKKGLLPYKNIYKSSNFADWNDYENGVSAWVRNNNTITPTAIGGYVNNILSGAIVLNKTYKSNFKKISFVVTMYTDTVLNIHFVADDMNDGSHPNISMFEVDFVTRQLLMRRNLNNVIQSNYVAYKGITIPIANAKYIVEIERDDIDFYFRLKDYKTGEYCELKHSGWSAGTLQSKLAFSWGAGVNAPIITNVNIYEPYRATYMLVGDSITEGYGMVSDANRRYAELFRQSVPNVTINACSSDGIEDVIERFDYEIALQKPKTIVFTIGTNNLYKTENEMITLFDSLIAKCTANGIGVVLNHVPIRADNVALVAKCITMNGVIDSYGYDGALFDVATALNNTPSQGINATMFIDNIHPNTKGSLAMFQRLKTDLSFLFN